MESFFLLFTKNLNNFIRKCEFEKIRTDLSSKRVYIVPNSFPNSTHGSERNYINR